MIDCLTRDEIEKLLTGVMPATEKNRAEAHLAKCESCRKKLEVQQAERQLADEIQDAFVDTISYDSNARSDRFENRAQVFQPLPAKSFDDYEILSEIHRGGQGIVYKAIQKATKRTVAIKLLLHGPYASRRQQHRVEREVDLAASLRHPNIVTIYDSGVTKDKHHYFAMEFVDGQPLDHYLSQALLNIDAKLALFGNRQCLRKLNK